MSTLPREPEAFTEHVARLFKQAVGRRTVEIVGPLELIIDDHRLDLDNLYRAARSVDDTDLDELAATYVDTKLASWRLEQTPLPFEIARARVLPHLASIDQLQRRGRDHLAALPYVNDLCVCYLIDINGARVAVTIEQLVRWGVNTDQLDGIARRNLAHYQPELELRFYRSDEAAAALFNAGDGYDASRILLDRLHAELAPELGGDFLVAIPSRDVFIAFPTEPEGFIDRLRQRVETDFRQLPYPITDHLFLVTQDGVAPWSDAA